MKFQLVNRFLFKGEWLTPKWGYSEIYWLMSCDINCVCFCSCFNSSKMCPVIQKSPRKYVSKNFLRGFIFAFPPPLGVCSKSARWYCMLLAKWRPDDFVQAPHSNKIQFWRKWQCFSGGLRAESVGILPASLSPSLQYKSLPSLPLLLCFIWGPGFSAGFVRWRENIALWADFFLNTRKLRFAHRAPVCTFVRWAVPKHFSSFCQPYHMHIL